MNKNKILDFILEEVQWGRKKINQKFWSEKQLQIKFDVSLTTSKNALNIAEALGLLIGGKKGISRTTNDFTYYTYISKYFSIKKSDMTIKKIFPKNYSKSNKKMIKKYSYFIKNKDYIIFNLNYKQQNIGMFLSIINNKTLFKKISILKDFTQCLKQSKILIKKVNKKTYIEENEVIIQRELISRDNYIFEKSFLHINKDFFVLNQSKSFPFTKKIC